MTEQIIESTNKGLKALLSLVLGEITVEQAEEIINNMNVKESDSRENR